MHAQDPDGMERWRKKSCGVTRSPWGRFPSLFLSCTYWPSGIKENPNVWPAMAFPSNALLVSPQPERNQRCVSHLVVSFVPFHLGHFVVKRLLFQPCGPVVSHSAPSVSVSCLLVRAQASPGARSLRRDIVFPLGHLSGDKGC